MNYNVKQNDGEQELTAKNVAKKIAKERPWPSVRKRDSTEH